jgi:hypothetical protein
MLSKNSVDTEAVSKMLVLQKAGYNPNKCRKHRDPAATAISGFVSKGLS